MKRLTTLLAALLALASGFCHAQLVTAPFIQEGSGAVPRTFLDRARDIVSVKDFGCKGNGVADDTSCIQAAINAVAASGRVHFPKGNYKVTSTVTVSNNGVHLTGDGPYATQITFAPTANGSALKIINGSSVIYQGSVRDMAFRSDDLTYVKTAIEVVDSSGYLIDNIVIGGSVVVGRSGFWADSSNRSIGIRTRGREAASFRNIYNFANKPIVISPNPNAGIQISADHFNFHNLYLGCAANPCVTVESGSVLTQVSFTGYQAWVAGHGGFYWVDATKPGASNGLLLQNVRYENPTDATKYFVRIESASGVQQLQIIGGQTGGVNGFYLRGINQARFASFTFGLTGYEAMNADTTVLEMTFDSNFWQTGTTATLTGLQIAHKAPTLASGPLPSTGYIIKAPTGSYDEINEGTVAAKEVTLAASGTYVIGGLQQTGLIMITTRDNVTALYILRGAAGTVAEVSDIDNYFTPTQGTPNKFNVYWDAGASKYVVVNGFAVSKQLRVLRMGRAQ